MPPLLPLLIPGERATRIIEYETDKMLDRFEEMAEVVYPDMLLPGMKVLPARQRALRYVFLIDPTIREVLNPRFVLTAEGQLNLAYILFVFVNHAVDMPLIRDVDYLKKRKQGLAPNPTSPFLLNALQPDDDFRQIAADVRELMRDYEVPGW